MKTRLLFFFFIVCSLNMVLGQELPAIIPPSPEATSLGKFTDMPVSHYTGLPNISIPLHSIKLGNAEIPISLSYHAKGIRVEEIASRVGIGWALNSGGVISRQIRGSNDEGSGNITGYLTDDFFTTFFDDTPTGVSTRLNVYGKAVLNQVDLHPDVFTFNFMGYSGKFLFDQRTKEPVLQEYSDLTIEPIWSGNTINRIEAWVVTTPNGYKGYFGESLNGLRFARDKENVLGQYLYNENGLTVISGDGADDPYSSWYLLDIISPNGESITYTYEEETPIYYRRSFDKVNQGSPSSNFSRVMPTQNQIKEIVFDGGKVLFHKNTVDDRQDLDNAYALDEIEVKDKNNNLIKSYKFNYTYTHKAADNNVLFHLATADPKASKRMFLNTITTFDKNKANSLPPYKFYYNSTVLPNRFSNSQDNWGFYNGQNNGQYLTLFGYGNVSVNREVDVARSKAGILTKIEYPTGGSVSYEYEHNQAPPPPYFQELFFPNTNPTVQKNASIVKNSLFWKGTYYETDIFTISSNVISGTLRSNINISPSTHCSATQANVNCEYVVELKRKSGPSTPLFIGLNDLSSVTFPPGDYKIKVTPKNVGSEDPTDWETNYFSVLLTWDEQGVSTQDLIYTSGNRIQKIILDDAKGNTITKEYEYDDPNGDPSGKVFSLPVYYHIENPLQNAILFSRKYGARPGSPLTYEQGNHEGYEYVTEYLVGDNGREGKTEYRFTTVPDGGKFYEFPYTPAIDNEWLRGKPIDIIHYKKEHGAYSEIQSVHNEYRYGDFSDFPSFFSQPIFPVGQNRVYEKTKRRYYLPLMVFFNQDATYGDPDEHNEYKVYYHTSGTQHLHSTTETTFSDNGDELINETTYHYNYDNHYQLSETRTKTSDNEPIITKTYYPDDILTAYSYKDDSTIKGGLLNDYIATDRLKKDDLHQVSTPKQTETYVDKDNDGVADSNELISLQRTNFYEPHTDLVLPKEVQTLKGIYNSSTNALQDRIIYHEYDDTGNPIELSKADGTHIVYVWGYNGEYPVAKIENATKSQVDALNLNTNLINNTGTSDSAMRSELHKIRTGLSNAMVTTYTYAPLIGLTSVTDPKGYTMYYEYDTFNRLEFVKDDDDNILSENEYNYKQ